MTPRLDLRMDTTTTTSTSSLPGHTMLLIQLPVSAELLQRNGLRLNPSRPVALISSGICCPVVSREALGTCAVTLPSAACWTAEVSGLALGLSSGKHRDNFQRERKRRRWGSRVFFLISSDGRRIVDLSVSRGALTDPVGRIS